MSVINMSKAEQQQKQYLAVQIYFIFKFDKLNRFGHLTYINQV